MTYVIAQPCVDIKDKACIEECPVDCIYEGKRSLYIHPDECVDCGACEPVCPVEAIFYEDDTPAQWKDYYRANVDFFTETTTIGSPGGASKVGPVDLDHPVVMAVPVPHDHRAGGVLRPGLQHAQHVAVLPVGEPSTHDHARSDVRSGQVERVAHGGRGHSRPRSLPGRHISDTRSTAP